MLSNMKLIIRPHDFEKEFHRLANQYQKYYWAVAWAGISSSPFVELTENIGKIEKIIVGIHFYQTHPGFIEAFLDNKQVKFIKQPQGTFHPKLYLFYNGPLEWEILVGSGNFTEAAFTNNTEAVTLITSTDQGAKEILKSAFTLIENCWNDSQPFTADELEKYRLTWKNQRLKINSLSGIYGGNRNIPKPIYKSEVTSMRWEEFIAAVLNETEHSPESRVGVITKSREFFNKVSQFNQLDLHERKFIAGLPNKLKDRVGMDWGLFGSMKGSGNFHNRINENDIHISNALDKIPISGQITKAHYESYISNFIKTLSDRTYLATASRLLAMRRPDTFVCLDGRNAKNLCKAFGINHQNMTYERYWDDIVERIFDSDWWINPKPIGALQWQISEARAAFLDSLYYEE